MIPGLTHLAASTSLILCRMDPTSLWNRHCIQPWCSDLGCTALPCPHSRYSIYIPIASTRAHLRRVHPINIYGRHAHPRSSAGAGAEPSWAQHTRHSLGSRQKPPESLCCLPIAPPCAHTGFHPCHTDTLQGPVTERVRTVWVVDAQGSSPGSVSGWDLGTHSPQKDSKQLYPPSFH